MSAAALTLALAACEDVQSALAPRSPQAEDIALLSWILFAGAAAIFVLVLVAASIALYGREAGRGWLAREAVIVGGGIVFPAVTLAVLLIYGFVLTRAGGAPLPGGEPLRIAVTGEQWWWRVVYGSGDAAFESANEIRVPVGRAIEITLTTADVIHSFWVPHYGGKVDMIPGRANRFTFAATTPGLSRGQCAEYCGGAHALMSFHVVALPAAEFEAWRASEAGPAMTPETPAARTGEALFLSSGCGACHTVRGTAARGVIGPDLTHVGSRHAIGAATLAMSEAALARWITDNQHIKPENRMPPFRIFREDELAALAAYLAGLR